MSNSSNLILKVEGYVVDLFKDQLPQSRLFHNIDHTRQVVHGVKEISKALNLSLEKVQMLILAAWLHDTGHIRVYEGHEKVSMQIADDFLTRQGYNLENKKNVLELIQVTALPQMPQNELQEIICDADLYHLSSPEYFDIQKRLRSEWLIVLGLDFTDLEWKISNVKFLEEHHYFTSYGKETLSRRKEINVRNCKVFLN